ncbi:MAG: peptide chain release factor 2 [Deltaproteobacteria bacterium]|nr:peptide chain release factor 2 [Deltaproteobacteria bacterium]
MSKELREIISQLNAQIEQLRRSLDVDRKAVLLKEKEAESEKPDFWQDTRRAKLVSKEITDLKNQMQAWKGAQTSVSDAAIMLDLAIEAGDPESLAEAGVKAAEAGKFLSDLEFAKMLSGPQDASGCFLQINAGAGGTESCDWASIILRMYLRYCESKGFKAEMIDFTEGDGAGYRSVTLSIAGAYSYGYLKAEIGVHRLVRISPFDANKRRHTSFVSVFVYPDIEEDLDIEVNEADLRIDTYRAGGAGGQKVNKTDSAVRMTHFPSGIVVQCQNERSQHQNRAMAMKMLKARLFDLEMEKKRAEQAKVEATKKDIAWGSQIRSYVLQPYQMVKDHRSGYETSQTQKVLDGELDELIRKYLVM